MTSRAHRALLVVVVAAAWALPIAARLWRTPSSWWIARDDGVITLSHARNLVDHGTIGVSPGGDRVEGFSSPLHFATAVLIDLVTDLDAQALTMVVLVVGMTVAGLAFAYGVCTRLDMLELDTRWWSVATVAGAGVTSAVAWTTTGWIGSGMENPVVVAAGACVAAAALAGLDTVGTRVLAVVGLVAFSLARVEFAALVLPLIAAVVVAGSPNGRPARRDIVELAVIPLAAIAAVHLLRRWYFGAWLPNTAIVQDRGAGSSQVVLIGALGLVLVGLMLRSTSTEPLVRRAGTALAVVGGVGALWLDAAGRSGAPIGSFLQVPGVVPVGLAIWALIGARALLGRRPDVRVHWVLWGLAAVPLSQLVVAGPARLDDHRVAGIGVVFLAISAAVAAAELWSDRAAVPTVRLPRLAEQTAAPKLLGVVVALAGTTAVVGTWRSDQVHALNYEVAWAADVIDAVDRFADDQLPAGAATITANPDLGKVSFEKRSVMVDLGWLGDPLMATLRADRPDLMSDYLGAIAVPDVVSSHSGWSCEYRAWLESASFVDAYRLDTEPAVEWVRPDDSCPLDGLRGVWIRVEGDPEYDLVAAIEGATDPVEVVGSAIDECVELDGDALRCQPVRRAVQRVADGLRDRGLFDEILARFEAAPSAAFDRPMLERGPRWWAQAADEVAVLLDGRR